MCFVAIYLLLFLYLINTSLGQRTERGRSNPKRSDPQPSNSSGDPYYPYYGYRYFCPGSHHGLLDDPCDEYNSCVNEYSLECQNGTCQCRKDYLPSSQNNGLCEYVPGLYQSCQTECQKPLVCRGPQTSTQQPTESPTPETVDGEENEATPPSETVSPSYYYPPSGGKTCHCDPPYVLDNWYSYCHLECPPDQYYDSKDLTCKPRCQADQVKLEDGSCAKAAKLGEPCSGDLQCVEEYSICIKGTCGCQPGFVATEGNCVDKKYSCPWGKPDKGENGEVLQCNKTTEYYPYHRQHDTCPIGSFCLISPPWYNYHPENVESGYCCPNACPVGEALENSFCELVYHDGQDTLPPPKPCPSSHYCYKVNIGYDYYQSVCCPKACRDGFVLVDGLCYQEVAYGDKCVVDEQCARFHGICSNGTCACSSNSQLVTSGTYKYCSVPDVYCSPDKVRYGDKCYERLKLNDTCPADPPVNLCPYNAGCDEDNKCSCYCHNIPIGGRCEPYPVCRKSYHTYYEGSGSTVGEFESSTQVGEDPTSEAPQYEPQGDEDYIFCTAYGYKPPVPAVTNCPEGQYCNYYLYDLGLCCPIPDPLCPDGTENEQFCDPDQPNECSDGYYCYAYFRAIAGDPPSGGVCCVTYAGSNVQPSPRWS